MTTSGRPIPIPDEQSAPFWKAAGSHTLAIARCSRCGALTHPPDVICPHCHSTDPAFAFVPVSGNGAVRSWTVMHQSFLPGFDDDLPFVLVDVELEEQADLRMIGRLIDGPSPRLSVGAAVRRAFEDLGPGISVPAFRLEDGR